MSEPDRNDNILDNVVEVDVEIPFDEGEQMAVNLEYWQERLYKAVDTYDMDAKFWENQGKSTHLEGKMSAREMTFAKGGGLPAVMPLPANQNAGPVPGP